MKYVIKDSVTDIEVIRAKYLHYGPTETLKPNTAVLDIRLLLEEIDKLKTLTKEE